MEDKIKTIISSYNNGHGTAITLVYEYKGNLETKHYAYPALVPEDLMIFIRKCAAYGFKKVLSTDYIDVWEKR